MPRAKIVTQPEPDDALHPIRVNSHQICANPNCPRLHAVVAILLKPGDKAWWDHRDKKVYCPQCKEWRLSEEGIRFAVMSRLLGRGVTTTIPEFVIDTDE